MDARETPTEHQFSEHPSIFFEREGSWRQLPYPLVAAFLVAAGVVGIVVVISGLATYELTIGRAAGSALFFVIAINLLAAGLHLICSILLRPKWTTQIGEHGITMTARHWPWTDVVRLFTKASRRSLFGGERVALCFHRRNVPLDYFIMGFHSLTETSGIRFRKPFEFGGYFGKRRHEFSRYGP